MTLEVQEDKGLTLRLILSSLIYERPFVSELRYIILIFIRFDLAFIET